MKRNNGLGLRLTGLASILAGVIWTAGTILNLVVGGSIEPANTLAALLAISATSLMVFAFIGIYAVQSEWLGLLGLLGTGLGAVGAVLLTGVNTVVFAKSVGAVQVSRPPVEIGAPGVLGLVAGVLLLGVTTMRAGVVNKWSGVPFILATALVPFRAFGRSLGALAIFSASIGFVWLGFEIWSGPTGEQIRAEKRPSTVSSA